MPPLPRTQLLRDRSAAGSSTGVTPEPGPATPALAPFARPEPMVLAGWTATLVRTLADQGHDADALVRAAGIDPATLERGDARIPLAGTTRLWTLAVEATGNQALGLDVAAYVRPTTFHSLSQAVLASTTLRDGLERMARYSRVVADPAASVTEDDADTFSFVIRWTRGVPPPSVHSIDAILATVVGQCELMGGQPVRPLAVHLQRSRPGEAARFEAHFGCPVRFEAPEARLVFDRRTVERRLPAGEGELARRNDEVVSDYLDHLAAAPSVAQQVRRVLLGLLPSGPPTASEVAACLATSPRSLQRHLADEGLTFRDLLQEVRCELAVGYLRQGSLSVHETARRLGFSDATAFSRAFKRWTGVAPSRLG